MKKCTLAMLAALLCVVTAKSEDLVILPWGVDQPWQMKYVYGEDLVSEDENGTPWYAPNYDDSAWDTLTGPIERNTTNWFSQSFFGWEREGSVLYLRRTFNLDEIPTGKIVVKAIVDDYLSIYINGHQLKRIALGNGVFYIVPQSVLVEGENLMAFDLNDAGGGDARCDYGMFVTDDNNFYTTPSGEKYYVDELGIIYSYEPYDEERGELEDERAERYAVIGLTEDGASDLVFKEEIEGIPVKYIRDTAFLYGNIRSVTIPNFYYVGAFSFQGCGNLASVHLSKGVQYVGFDAFTDCGNLTSITVDEENPWIDSRDNCNGVIETATNKLISGCKNTVIPYGVTSINYEAFLGNGLTSITIPASVTSFDGAFHNNGGMKSMTVEWTEPLEIQEGALEGIYVDQATLYVPEGTKEAYEAAAVWKDFKQIIEKKTTYVDECGVIYSLVPRNGGNAEHYEVTGVTNNYTSDVVIQEKVFDVPVASIGASAFLNCSSLTSVTIPTNVTSIGNNAFYNCSGLTSVTINSNMIISKTYSSITSLKSVFGNQVKEYILGDEVTSIGNYAFNGCSGLASVTIGNSVTSIGNSAFAGCTGLTSVTIPTKVTSIGNSAFAGCTGLTSVTIPTKVTSIGNSAFAGCTGLTSVTIPTKVTSIGNSAFAGCTGLTSLYVKWAEPLTVPGNIFENVSLSQATLYVPAGSQTAYQNADVWKDFNIQEKEGNYVDEQGVIYVYVAEDEEHTEHYEASGLAEEYATDIVIKDKIYGVPVTNIGEFAFECSGLTSVTIQSSEMYLGYRAFGYIGDLESFTVSKDVKKLHVPGSVGAFEGSGNLSTMTVDPENPYYDSRDNCNAIIETSSNTLMAGCNGTIIPNSVTTVGEGAFYGCSPTSIDIPSSVTRIGDYAFEGSSLTSVTIQSSEISIGGRAFGYIGDLESFTVSKDVKKLHVPGFVGPFEGSGNLSTMTVDPENPYYDSRDNCNAIIETSSNTLIAGCNGTIIPNSVTTVGEGAFWGCNLTSLDIPSSVTRIGDYAFEGSSLTSVTIQSSEISIGGRAFGYMGGLESFTVSDNVTGINLDGGAFDETYISQATLYVPYGTKAAYESADVWKDFGNIEEYSSLFVEGTEGPVTLSQGASTHVSVKFGCDKPLTAFQFSIQMPDGLSLSEQALNSDMSNGHKLTVQNKGNGLYNILCSNMKDKAFKELSGELMSFTLSCTVEVEPNTYKAFIRGIRFVDENGEYVIMPDHSFNITVSDPPINFADEAVKALCVANWDTNGDGELSMAEAAAVTELGEVFKNNEEITSFDELQYFTGLTSIGAAAFDNCHNLTSVVIPDQVTSLESCAFIGCWSLPTLVIPDGVTNIHEMAVGWCIGMNSITIPSSVTYMESQALKNNGSLASVTVEWQEPLAVPDNLFMDVALEKVVLYVPAGTKDAYKAANVWKDFGKIIEYADLVENGRMEDEPSEDWSCFWVREWRTMEEIFVGPANIVEDPADASNHCVKVVVRSEARADAAGNKELDADGNFALFDSQFFIQSKDKIESGKRLKLTMRVRADKPAEIITEAHNMPTDHNYYGLFDNINVTPVWQKIEREVIVTPEMTQEDLDKEMHTVAFHLTTRADGNVFYFDDIRLEVMNRVNDLYAGEPGTPTEIYQGSSATVSLCLDNETTLSSFQFALKLPEGISIKKVNGKFDCVLNSERTDGHSLAVTEQGEGIYAFLCSNMKDLPLKGNNGELLTITIACDEETTPDDYQAVISDIKFVDTRNEYVMLDDCSFDIAVKQLTIGDVNDNGQIDVQDLQQMVKYMLDKPMTQAFIFEAADIDNNGTINVMDVVSEVELIFNNFNAAESCIFDELGSGLSLVTSGDGAVHVSMADGQPYVASQFVVELSDGQKLAGVTTDRSHTAVIKPMADNRYLVVCYSSDNRVFAAQDKPLTLHVTGRGNVAMDQVSFLDAKDQMVAFQNVSSGYTTGISEAEANSLKPTSIYSIGGMVVKENASSLKGLPSGVYIVNGKKHSKK